MRWVAIATLIPLGSCLVGIGDVDSDHPASGGSSGTASGATGATAASGGKSNDASAGGTSGSGGTGGTSAGGSGGVAGMLQGGGGGVAGTPATGGAGGTPIFSDTFDTGKLDNWTALGDGVWSVNNSQAFQASQNATNATLYATNVSVSEVKVVVKVTQSAGPATGSLEILTRYDLTKDTFYHCNWEPNDTRLILKIYNGTSSSVMAQKTVVTPSSYDPKAPVTFEMTAVGQTITCSILEFSDAMINATSTTALGAGTIAIKTYTMSGWFDDVAVYQL